MPFKIAHSGTLGLQGHDHTWFEFDTSRERSELARVSGEARKAVNEPSAAAPSTLRLALAVGVTGMLFVLAAAVLMPDAVMAMLPWRANEAFLPSNSTDVARGCSGIDTVPDFTFDRCALFDFRRDS